jgi:hypothetical protein
VLANVSLVNSRYQPVREPMVFELEDGKVRRVSQKTKGERTNV